MPLDTRPLQRALGKLQRSRGAIRHHARYLVPDLALLGFLNDVEENAQAVEVLVSASVGQRAHPSARAAFEASQLALLLATDEDYQLAGARAWIYYLRRDREFGNLHPEEFSQAAGGMTPDERFRLAVTEISDVWEACWAGGAAIVQKALDLVENQPKRPDNFAALPVAPTLRTRWQALQQKRGSEATGDDAAAIYNRAYAALSREAHPGTRLRPEEVRRLPTGELQFRFEERDAAEVMQGAIDIAAASVLQAVAAVGARSALPTA